MHTYNVIRTVVSLVDADGPVEAQAIFDNRLAIASGLLDANSIDLVDFTVGDMGDVFHSDTCQCQRFATANRLGAYADRFAR